MKQYQFILTYNNVSTELDISPAGWNEIGVHFFRHTFYHSILRSMALSLRFARVTGGGADIILQAYSDHGIAAQVGITINKRNPATNGYILFYQGVLDFKPGAFTIERDFIEIGIMDGMKEQKFISRDTINYNLFNTVSSDNITVDEFETEYKTIELTPIDIILESSLTGTVNGDDNWSGHQSTRTVNIQNAVYTKNEIGERLTVDNVGTIYTNNTDDPINIGLHYSGNFTTVGYADSDIGGLVNLNIYYRIRFFDSESTEIYNHIIFHGWVVAQGETTTNFNYTRTFDVGLFRTVPAGGYIDISTEYELLQLQVGTPQAVFTQTGNVALNIIEYSPGKANTTTKCLFPYEAFTRLVQLQTSELDTAKLFHCDFFGRTDSEFETYAINGPGSLDAITNGKLIRNYPDEPLTVNMRDLFKSFDAVYNLGLGYDRVNDRFYIDRKSKFFDSSYLMFDLGEVANLKISPLEEGYFNKILGGYDYEGEYEDFQGAFEFNLQREYALSTPVKEDADYRGKYNFDSIGVELARRKQYFDNSSKDTRYDKLVYIIKTDGSNPILGSNLEGFRGIEQYYNTMLTPRQNATRWGNVLKTALYKNNNPIKFQTASKQFEMTVDGVNEFSDIAQTDIPDDPIFIPELYSFESYITTDYLTILNANPHGFIRFTYEGVTYEGYVKEIKTGDYNKKATYELFAKAISNADNFIYEDGDNFILEDGDNLIYES